MESLRTPRPENLVELFIVLIVPLGEAGLDIMDLELALIQRWNQRRDIGSPGHQEGLMKHQLPFLRQNIIDKEPGRIGMGRPLRDRYGVG